jgi:hypothetical protein
MPDTGIILYAVLVGGIVALLAWADRNRSRKERDKR